MFLLQCPKCKNTMKYETQDKSIILTGKKKQCVYCGRSFGVRENLVKKL